MAHPQPCGKGGGAAAEMQGGTAAALAPHLDLLPGDAVLDAGAQSLGPGLLGREAGGKAFRGFFLAHAVRDFTGSEDAAEEAFAEPVDGRLNAINFDDVDTGADEHVRKLNEIRPR